MSRIICTYPQGVPSGTDGSSIDDMMSGVAEVVTGGLVEEVGWGAWSLGAQALVGSAELYRTMREMAHCEYHPPLDLGPISC